ncbi:MAG TPA: hypothetical protein VK186_04280, partial [Candidatus Deferrimicrobium sp.]|nr:hypothetical protein [Candidatus Deferrimicrobium sp.]
SRYSDMIKDIQVLQRELEGKFLADQPEIDNQAQELYKRSPQMARDYLTEYSGQQGDETVKRWRKLGETLIVKYMDGNVKDEKGKITHPKYPESWYRSIIKETGDKYKVIGKEERP